MRAVLLQPQARESGALSKTIRRKAPAIIAAAADRLPAGRKVETALPFAIRGFDCDNGSESSGGGSREIG